MRLVRWRSPCSYVTRNLRESRYLGCSMDRAMKLRTRPIVEWKSAPVVWMLLGQVAQL